MVAKKGLRNSFETKAIIQRGPIEHEQIINISSNRRMYETTKGLAVKITLNPRHRNADLPFSQQWHPSERRPLLPSTAPFRGIHLSSTGLAKADGTRRVRTDFEGQNSKTFPRPFFVFPELKTVWAYIHISRTHARTHTHTVCKLQPDETVCTSGLD